MSKPTHHGFSSSGQGLVDLRQFAQSAAPPPPPVYQDPDRLPNLVILSGIGAGAVALFKFRTPDGMVMWAGEPQGWDAEGRPVRCGKNLVVTMTGDAEPATAARFLFLGKRDDERKEDINIGAVFAQIRNAFRKQMVVQADQERTATRSQVQAYLQALVAPAKLIVAEGVMDSADETFFSRTDLGLLPYRIAAENGFTFHFSDGVFGSMSRSTSIVEGPWSDSADQQAVIEMLGLRHVSSLQYVGLTVTHERKPKGQGQVGDAAPADKPPQTEEKSKTVDAQTKELDTAIRVVASAEEAEETSAQTTDDTHSTDDNAGDIVDESVAQATVNALAEQAIAEHVEATAEATAEPKKARKGKKTAAG